MRAGSPWNGRIPNKGHPAQPATLGLPRLGSVSNLRAVQLELPLVNFVSLSAELCRPALC